MRHFRQYHSRDLDYCEVSRFEVLPEENSISENEPDYALEELSELNDEIQTQENNNQEVEECFTSITNVEEISNKIKEFSTNLIVAKSKSRLYDSEHKIRKEYESHPLFFSPELVVINTTLENSYGTDGK